MPVGDQSWQGGGARVQEAASQIQKGSLSFPAGV